MDRGFPVRIPRSLSPRALIPDNTTHKTMTTVEFTSTTVVSTCSAYNSTSRSSNVVNSQLPSQTPRRKLSFPTLGRAAEIPLLSISVRVLPQFEKERKQI